MEAFKANASARKLIGEEDFSASFEKARIKAPPALNNPATFFMVQLERELYKAISGKSKTFTLAGFANEAERKQLAGFLTYLCIILKQDGQKISFTSKPIVADGGLALKISALDRGALFAHVKKKRNNLAEQKKQ